MKKGNIWLALFVVFGLYWWLGWSLLTEKPSVWPDEAVYAEIVDNFLAEGRLGSDLWEGLIPGVERMALWNPPGYLLFLSGWVGVFGQGIGQMRWLSLSLGSLILVGLGLVGRELLGKKDRWWVVGLLGFMVVDFEFMRGARLARPEVLVVVVVVWSQVVLLVARKRRDAMWWLIAGGLVGSAVLAHPLAVVFGVSGLVVGWLWDRKRLLKLWGSYLVGMGLPVVVWLVGIWGEWGNLLTQLRLASQRKAVELSWVVQAWNGDNPIFKLIIGGLLVASVVVVRYGWWGKRKEGKYLVGMVVVSMVTAVLGKQFWYVLYALPWVYLGLVYLVTKKNRWARWVLVGLVVLNGLYAGVDWMRIKSLGLSYEEFVAGVLKEVPDKKTVFLSAIPDPYFGFVAAERRNELVEFPVYEMSLDKYEMVLDNIDYVVYTKDQSKVLFGDFFELYLRENMKEMKRVEAGGYRAIVFELVERSERVSVVGGQE